MLLVFGLNTTVRLLGSPSRPCRHCGNNGRHEVVESARRFSFFFVPLFRVGAVRYFDTCTVCGVETELTRAQTQVGPDGHDAIKPQDAAAWGPQDR
jgi:hypothetical protein